MQKLTISDNHLEVREEDIDKGHGHSGQGALDSDSDAEGVGNGGEEVGQGADVGEQSDERVGVVQKIVGKVVAVVHLILSK